MIEVIKGRILSFLMPPTLPASASSTDLGVPMALCSCWSDPDGQKDRRARMEVAERRRKAVFWGLVPLGSPESHSGG